MAPDTEQRAAASALEYALRIEAAVARAALAWDAGLETEITKLRMEDEHYG